MQFLGLTLITTKMWRDDDDEYYEDDVEWHTGNCDDELEESAYTVGTPTDYTELLEQFDGNLDDADASASQVYASASRSFQEARGLLSHVKSARGYIPVVGTGAFGGVNQPSYWRNPARSRGKGKRKRKTSSYKGGTFPNLGTLRLLPKPPTSRSESRPPTSKKRPTETGTTRGGPHHAPRLRPDQCMFCRQVGHRASECHNKGKAISFSPGKRAFGNYALGLCSMSCVTVEETEDDQNPNDTEDVDAVLIQEFGRVVRLS